MDYKNTSDEELVKASRTGIHKESYEAQAEMTRRLKDSIDKMSNSTDFYSDRLLDLTVLLLFIGVLQLIVSLRTISESMGQWLIFIGMFLFVIGRAVNYLKKRKR